MTTLTFDEEMILDKYHFTTLKEFTQNYIDNNNKYKKSAINLLNKL